MDSQRFYIKALIDTLKPFGDVLEIGFDQGTASELIQSYRPNTHTIIERNPEVAKIARKWASKYSNITIIEGSWQEVLPNLSTFDTLFFNQTDPTLISFCPKESHVILKQGEELLANVYKTFPALNSLCYSNKELEDLYGEVGLLHPKEFAQFLSELKGRNQISNEQYERLLKQYSLPNPEIKKKSFQDTALIFLEKCIKGHLKQGSRFSCVSSFPISKYEDPQFFDQVITNPEFDYQEIFISVDPSENYHFKEALVLILNKVC